MFELKSLRQDYATEYKLQGQFKVAKQIRKEKWRQNDYRTRTVCVCMQTWVIHFVIAETTESKANLSLFRRCCCFVFILSGKNVKNVKKRRELTYINVENEREKNRVQLQTLDLYRRWSHLDRHTFISWSLQMFENNWKKEWKEAKRRETIGHEKITKWHFCWL